MRAVEAERAELERHRARLLHTRESLLGELERIESGLAEVDERRALLRRLAPPPATGEPSSEPSDAGGADRGAPAPAAELRGPAVRAAAVRVLLEHPDGAEALHYREWFELLLRRGHRVAGKDPLAVFLTQLSRSPVVRRGTQPGVYELDRAAARRLRARIGRVQEQLRELAAGAGAAPAATAAVRTRRSQLTTELGRLERALEEAASLLGSGDAQPAAAA